MIKEKDDLQTELLSLKEENRRLHRLVDTADNYKKALEESKDLYKMIVNMKKIVEEIFPRFPENCSSEQNSVDEKSRKERLTLGETKVIYLYENCIKM